MQVRRFDNAAEFYNHVEPFLLAHEAEHNLILGLCTTLIKTDTYREAPYLGYVEKDGEVAAVAMRTPPNNLAVSCITDTHALTPLVEDVKSVFSDLPGVVGMKEVSRCFAERWRDVTGRSYRIKRAMRIYKLEQVKSVTGVSGDVRSVTAAERELLVEWLIAFSAEALHEDMPREEAERIADLRLDAAPEIRGTRLWYDGGKPVSLAGYTGPTPNGIRIGPVYTPLVYRKRGYAGALTAALSQELLDSGRKFCFLFTDLNNPTSNHVYQAIGYEPVTDVDEYDFVD